jgi:hypothetical protein
VSAIRATSLRRSEDRGAPRSTSRQGAQLSWRAFLFRSTSLATFEIGGERRLIVQIGRVVFAGQIRRRVDVAIRLVCARIRFGERHDKPRFLDGNRLGPPLGEEQRAKAVPHLVLESRLEAVQPESINGRLSRPLYDSDAHQSRKTRSNGE